MDTMPLSASKTSSSSADNRRQECVKLVENDQIDKIGGYDVNALLAVDVVWTILFNPMITLIIPSTTYVPWLT
nr:hypothetical protein Iba_chr12cCG20620 [Ipomoea batatas]